MNKWTWMMDYCNRNGFPPAQKWAWDKAELSYEKMINKRIGEDV